MPSVADVLGVAEAGALELVMVMLSAVTGALAAALAVGLVVTSGALLITSGALVESGALLITIGALVAAP